MADVINPDWLDELEAAAGQATPGEWEACGPSYGGQLPVYLCEVVAVDIPDDEHVTIANGPELDAEYQAERSANMAYIALAQPSSIIALIEEYRETILRTNANAEMCKRLQAENYELLAALGSIASELVKNNIGSAIIVARTALVKAKGVEQ